MPDADPAPGDYATRFLGEWVEVTVDRPLGSRHPAHGYVYPVNYGHIAGTLAPDSEEVDAYVLGVDGPLHQFRGRCIAVIHRLDDDDDKLIVVPAHLALSDEEIREQTWFQEQHFVSVIIRVPERSGR